MRGNDVLCRVAAGGELRSRKGLNVPGVDLGIAALLLLGALAGTEPVGAWQLGRHRLKPLLQLLQLLSRR